jgi:hypothetical protein
MRDKDARSWCRIGEALALDWSNVRLHEQSARIGMSKNGETPGHSIAIITRKQLTRRLNGDRMLLPLAKKVTGHHVWKC